MAVSRISLATLPDIRPKSQSVNLRHSIQTIIIMALLASYVQSNTPPKLGSYPQQLLVPENTPIGTIIGNITASDADGQQLFFKTDTEETGELVNLSDPRSVPNQPNTKIVDIILKSLLDRDYAPKERKLYFTVTDGSSSIPAWITMFIEDVNDVAPKFVFLPYEVTIKENTVVGSIIFTGVSAEDPDSGRSPSYTMESNAQAADEEYVTTFTIDQYNGNITLMRSLDYEKHSYYQFRIMAEDEGGLKADPAGFVVYVLDVQDTPPSFVNLPYSIQIDEDTPVGKSVQKVVAVDGDRGIPNNITYNFESGDFENFNLNATTGVITIKNNLDRDSDTMRNTGGVYAMTVKASEVVPEGQENYGATTATTLVTITVRDVNDNAPTFSQQIYRATIPENMQQGVPVAFQGNVMEVSDIDQGINSHFSLTFLKDGLPYYDFSPLPQEIYSESSVLIKVNNSEALDYEKNHSVVFQVVARELDTIEKRSNTATVTIEIEDMNDNAPVFSEPDFTLEITENTPAGTSVAQYNATDMDSGIYGSITYSLRGGNGKFSIEGKTGILRVTGNIDREEIEEFYLTVEAKDGGGLRTPAEVMVIVLDENDNRPVFKRDDYEGIVREETNKFLRPLKVEAFDNDKANTNNSKVLYRIAAAPPGLATNFSIDPATGEITITEPVDYEKLDPGLKGVITLTVEAYNVGDHNMSSQVLVNITVEDINDFAPVFQQSVYSTSIPENVTEGFLVYTVRAEDFDATSPNNYLIYRIESGALDKFRINFETGEVEVDKGADLDRETKDEYILSISAIDRGTPPLIGTCILKINLTDINDETPVFQPVTRMVEVRENAQKYYSVILFSATDPDLNSQLEYSLGAVTAFSSDKMDDPVNVTVTGVENYFGINSSTGEIFVQNNLDRETAVRVNLEVIVHDKMAEVGKQIATGTLNIRILDYNDNPPRFIPSPIYNVSVSESANIQSVVLQVTTTDADEGQTVNYSIKSNISAFAISSDGTVRLISTLDRESYELVEFQIIAKDSGNPQLTATATVIVSVLDANDNYPVFDPFNVSFSVAENEKVGFVVTTFRAEDEDSGDFGAVFFTLSGSDSTGGSFAIGENSGQLTVAKQLDRETKDMYMFEVVASDSKNNPVDRKSTRSQPITIYIEDVDDNPPVFKRVIPETPTVLESALLNQTVATVEAEDADDASTDNGLVLYSLTTNTNATQKNGSPLFSINSTSGDIMPTVSLQGYAGTYFITVRATNKRETYEATKEITIIVKDVNDHYPNFVKPNMDNAVAYVLENSEIGTSVFQLEAVDEDTGLNGKIRYSILSIANNNRDGSKTFEVNDLTGLITTKGDINAEVLDRYELRVQASDQGFPKPFATILTMIIVVLDKNDHKPEFSGYSMPYQISMEENKQTCANVSLAIDRDLNTTFTTICYYLVGTSLMDTFIMKTQTGMLCLNSTLDRETTPVVDIVIQALEDCYRSDIKTEKINPLEVGELPPDKLWIKIQVEDVNDNPPRFYSKDLALGVTRVTQYGKFIVDLRNDVEDADSARWGIDHFTATSNFSAYPEALKRELQNLGVVEPFKLFSNGSVKTNMYFKTQMSGFFMVDLKVFDKGGQSDTARLRISLINDDQRLIIVFRRTIENVGPIKDEIAKLIGSKVGCRIVVDSIQTHEMETGQADLARTDMFIHGEDLDTNEIIPATKLLSMIDLKSTLLVDVLNSYNILQIVPTKKDNIGSEVEERLKMALILVAVVLGSLCIILCIVLYSVHSRYKRKLKAAKALAYVNSGVEPDDLYKTNIPGANITSYENANPIFLEKIMLDYHEDGLDDNRFVCESTFDEHEMTMAVTNSDLYSKVVNESNKAEMYLSAVLAAHEADKDVRKAKTGQDELTSTTAATFEIPCVKPCFTKVHSNGIKSDRSHTALTDL